MEEQITMFNKSKKGAMSTQSIISVLLAVVIFGALGGVIATSIGDSKGNFTGGALALYILVPLLVVIVFVASLMKGVGGKR